MPAYWVARAKVNDPVEYKKYTDQVPAILAKYAANRWRAAAASRSWKAPRSFSALWCSSFRPFEQGVACFTSDEYKKAAAFRRSGAGEVETVIIEAL